MRTSMPGARPRVVTQAVAEHASAIVSAILLKFSRHPYGTWKLELPFARTLANGPKVSYSHSVRSVIDGEFDFEELKRETQQLLDDTFESISVTFDVSSAHRTDYGMMVTIEITPEPTPA